MAQPDTPDLSLGQLSPQVIGWDLGQPGGDQAAAFIGDHVIPCGPRLYRAIQWEISERHRWSGADRRRLKREWRRYVAGATATRSPGAAGR